MSNNFHHHEKNTLRRVIGLGLFGFLFLAVGFFLGTAATVRDAVYGEGGEVEISSVLNLYGKSRSSEVDFEQFWHIWDIVKKTYVNQPVSDVDLFYGALGGLVSGLEDPYSTYFPPVEAKEFAKDLDGEFGGIGAEIAKKNNQLTVVAPLPTSPAEAAGITSGDIIFAINGEDTSDMTLEEAVLKIRGEKGTVVILTISHGGFDEVADVSVVRDVITVPTVEWRSEENNLAYLRISYFNKNTWDEFDMAVKAMTLASPKGIILDLRSNPGGFLETSVDVASEWIEEGVIVKELFANNTENEYRTRGRHRLAGIPTVVLVDAGTASGSEIVAGALRDHGLATLVGEKTFGKGSVQDFQILSDGSALKLTVAKWLTPNGGAIDGAGIEPDIILAEMFEETTNADGSVDMVDKGLEKAKSLIR